MADIFGFQATLTMKDMLGEPIELVPATDKDGDALHLRDKDGGSRYEAEVSLSVEPYSEATSVLMLRARMQTHVPYDMRWHFAAYGAVSIELEAPHAPEGCLYSRFNTGNKSDCWVSPFFCEDFGDLSGRAAQLLYRYEGKYYQILPLCGKIAKTEITTVRHHLTLTVSPYAEGYDEISGPIAVMTEGDNPFEVCRVNAENGFRVLGKKPATAEHTPLSPVFDYIGWCSWDSLRLEVNEQGLYDKAQEFADKQIPVRWILIDDGWYQEDERRRAVSFEEVPEKFPHGLRECVRRLKQDYHMKYMGIWEALGGGWRCVAPNGDAARERPDVFQTLPNGTVFPRTDEGGSFAYWNYRHAPLADKGFDFIKVDVECAVENVTHGLGAIGQSTQNVYGALDASAAIYFGGACIHCTGMGMDGLWNHPIGMVSRNSGDFNPQEPASMNGFVCDNLYNSLYHSVFAVTDWDMMWSQSPTTRQNALLHAISGGPVYLSDPLGISDPKVIRAFCLSDGKLLKCTHNAMPAADRILRDPQKEPIGAKAWNEGKWAGYVGLFHANAKKEAIRDFVSPADCYGICGERFAVRDYETGETHVCGREERIPVTLEVYDARLFEIVPFVNGIAMLGCPDKYIADGVIETVVRTEAVTQYVIKEACDLLFMTDHAVRVEVNGEVREPVQEGAWYRITADGSAGQQIVTIR